MAGWLSSFLLGRPNYEVAFTVPPSTARIVPRAIAARNTILNGDMKKGVMKTDSPVVQISSNFLTMAQRDQFASFAGIRDTFLSFQARDDFSNVLEYNVSTDTTHVTLQNTSATRLSAALVAAGGSSQITVSGVFDNPSGTGTNYFTGGGTYADATRIVTLHTALGGATTACYATYTYKGWLVDMKEFPHNTMGGWVDRFSYDVELTGV